MPYHSRFGHREDPDWIGRQTTGPGKQLNLKGTSAEKQKIWPIVQLADWGDTVPVEQTAQVIDCGTRLPATGIMVFHWSGIAEQWDKLDALGRAYRVMQDSS